MEKADPGHCLFFPGALGMFRKFSCLLNTAKCGVIWFTGGLRRLRRKISRAGGLAEGSASWLVWVWVSLGRGLAMGGIPQSQGNRSEEQEALKGSQASATTLIRNNCRATMTFLLTLSLLLFASSFPPRIRLDHNGVAEFPASPHHKRVQEK